MKLGSLREQFRKEPAKKWPVPADVTIGRTPTGRPMQFHTESDGAHVTAEENVRTMSMMNLEGWVADIIEMTSQDWCGWSTICKQVEKTRPSSPIYFNVIIKPFDKSILPRAFTIKASNKTTTFVVPPPH